MEESAAEKYRSTEHLLTLHSRVVELEKRGGMTIFSEFIAPGGRI
jgi:hypothetical protein